MTFVRDTNFQLHYIPLFFIFFTFLYFRYCTSDYLCLIWRQNWKWTTRYIFLSFVLSFLPSFFPFCIASVHMYFIIAFLYIKQHSIFKLMFCFCFLSLFVVFLSLLLFFLSKFMNYFSLSFCLFNLSSSSIFFLYFFLSLCPCDTSWATLLHGSEETNLLFQTNALYWQQSHAPKRLILQKKILLKIATHILKLIYFSKLF